MNENELSRIIYESAIEVHRTLGGPGLLEKVYEEALVWELQQARVKVNRQVALPIIYKNNQLVSPLKIDLLVGDRVIVECKATLQMHEVYKAQLLTYLRLTSLKLGLLINFGSIRVKDGISRVVNGL
ncbi:MAG TPA: GxxExxY protein [Thiotrichaceae bacterium]|nr:GxxExxY protein [Thiotrichaceae bacterium]